MKGPLPKKLPIVNHECFTAQRFLFDIDGKHRRVFCIEFQFKFFKWIFDQTITIFYSFFILMIEVY